MLIVMIHPLSDVKTTSIGVGTRIWQYCVIFEGAIIGANCNICAFVLIESNVIIGNNVTIKSGVQLWDGVIVEDNVFIGPNVTFTNDLVPRSKNYPQNFLNTSVQEGASIGANSTIIAGNNIGKYSFIGAGSVVTKNIPPFTVWFGNPAKQKGFITKSGVLLDLEMRDSSGKIYSVGE